MTNEEMFNNNTNLAYKIANKFKDNYSDEFEDITQIALEGLWRAVKTYDESKGYKFSTYAYPIIHNTIYMYLRKLRRTPKDILSLSMPVGNDESLELADMIQSDFDIFEEFISQHNEYVIDQIQKNINHFIFLNDMDKLVTRRIMMGETQSSIAKDLNVQQASISRRLKRIRKKIVDNLYKDIL